MTQQGGKLPQLPDGLTHRERYYAYLLTPEWRAKRKAALERAGNRCQVCNTEKGLHVHHRTYDRVFRESLDDLTVLCRACHEKFHGIEKSRRKPKPVKAAKQKRKLQPVSVEVESKLERRLQERDPIRKAAVEAQQRQYEARRAAKATERERLKVARVTVTAEIKARNAEVRANRKRPEPPLELDPVEVERYGLYMAKMSARARRQVLREAA